MTDAEAVDRIMATAKRLGRKYYWEDVREMVSDGWIGFHGARKRWTATRGANLWTYAAHRVEGAMRDGIQTRLRFYYLVKPRYARDKGPALYTGGLLRPGEPIAREIAERGPIPHRGGCDAR